MTLLCRTEPEKRASRVFLPTQSQHYLDWSAQRFFYRTLEHLSCKCFQSLWSHNRWSWTCIYKCGVKSLFWDRKFLYVVLFPFAKKKEFLETKSWKEYFPNLLVITLLVKIFVFWDRDLKFWLHLRFWEPVKIKGSDLT